MSETVRCPFRNCQQIVPVTLELRRVGDTVPTVRRIVRHNHGTFMAVDDDGPCPASLMEYPLGMDEWAILRDVGRAMDLRYQRAVQAHREQLEREYRAQGPGGQYAGKAPLPTSRSLRGPHRMGREPGNESSAWVLGGRQDEDVARESDDVKGTVPDTVSGQQVGRSLMATVNEVCGMLNIVRTKGAEARDALDSAIQLLRECQAIAAEIVGDSVAQTPNTILTLENNSIEQLHEVQGAIDGIDGLAEQYINILHS